MCNLTNPPGVACCVSDDATSLLLFLGVAVIIGGHQALMWRRRLLTPEVRKATAIVGVPILVFALVAAAVTAVKILAN